MITQKAIERTFRDIVSLDSTSRNEGPVSSHIQEQLRELGLQITVDDIGNVIGFLPGEGEPILLNAHMDRVPEGRSNIPVRDGDILKSDGHTNLGADDGAGLAIILEATRQIVTHHRKHPPLVLAFTVQEEIGLYGAKALDVSKYGVTRGIVFDNAVEAGTVIVRGASYVACDITITGKAAHPGKNLADGVNALEVYHDAIRDNQIPIGESDKGNTRINIGKLEAGTARNVIPGDVRILAEVRSYLSDSDVEAQVAKMRVALELSARERGAHVECINKRLAVAYAVDSSERLVQQYKKIVESRGGLFQTAETFVASDANALRGEKGLKVFVVSTGVKNEHSVHESVSLSEMTLLSNDLLALLQTLAK